MQDNRQRVFYMLDLIEDKTGIMAHEIPELKDRLRLWQDENINTSSFMLTLNKFWDNINGNNTIGE